VAVAFLDERRRNPQPDDERVHVFPLRPASYSELVAHLFPPHLHGDFNCFRPSPATGYNEDLYAFLVSNTVRFRYSGISHRVDITMTETYIHQESKRDVPEVFKGRLAAAAGADELDLLEADQVALVLGAKVFPEYRVMVGNSSNRANLKTLTIDAAIVAGGAKSAGMVFEIEFSNSQSPKDSKGKSPLLHRPTQLTRPSQPSWPPATACIASLPCKWSTAHSSNGSPTRTSHTA